MRKRLLGRIRFLAAEQAWCRGDAGFRGEDEGGARRSPQLQSPESAELWVNSGPLTPPPNPYLSRRAHILLPTVLKLWFWGTVEDHGCAKMAPVLSQILDNPEKRNSGWPSGEGERQEQREASGERAGG